MKNFCFATSQATDFQMISKEILMLCIVVYADFFNLNVLFCLCVV